MSIPLLVFGHSHGWAIKRAQEEGATGWPTEFPLIGSRAFPDGLATEEAGKPFVTAKIAEHLPEKFVFGSVLFGNDHNSIAMIESSQPFDFIYPGFPTLADKTRDIIPVSALKEAIGASTTTLNRLFEALAEDARCAKILHFMPPPPTISNELLTPLAASLGGTPSNPWLRLKLWDLQRRMLEDVCAKNGVIVIPHPTTASDKHGFLLEEFSKDGVHALPSYARMQLGYAYKEMEGLAL